MSHINGYVIVIFFALVYIGVKRCFPRTINPNQLFLFPALLVLNGLHNVPALLPQAGAADFALMALAGLAGAALGWAQARRWVLQFNADASSVRMPGDPGLLVAILATFVFQFGLHYAIAAHLPLASSAAFVPLALIIWGALAGMPLGRAVNVWVRRGQAVADAGSMQTL